jgi:hypothetical protein
METQRQTRRLPEVQDFPIVGQRDYHAKSVQYTETAAPHQPVAQPVPRTYNHPAPQPHQTAPTSKPGFFARLFGRKSRQPQSQFEAPHYPQPQDSQLAHREQLGNSDRTKPQAPLRTHRRNDDEEYEMPIFFGADRK